MWLEAVRYINVPNNYVQYILMHRNKPYSGTIEARVNATAMGVIYTCNLYIFYRVYD
jgi:hypothetical protein